MKHHVIVKWNHLVEDKKEMLQKVKEVFRGVVEIEGVSTVEVFENITDRKNRFDVMIRMECTEEGLKRYDVSELHLNWKRDYDRFLEAKAVFDCE